MSYKPIIIEYENLVLAPLLVLQARNEDSKITIQQLINYKSLISTILANKNIPVSINTSPRARDYFAEHFKNIVNTTIEDEIELTTYSLNSNANLKILYKYLEKRLSKEILNILFDYNIIIRALKSKTKRRKLKSKH